MSTDFEKGVIGIGQMARELALREEIAELKVQVEYLKEIIRLNCVRMETGVVPTAVVENEEQHPVIEVNLSLYVNNRTDTKKSFLIRQSMLVEERHMSLFFAFHMEDALWKGIEKEAKQRAKKWRAKENKKDWERN